MSWTNFPFKFAQTLKSDPPFGWREVTPGADEITPNLRAIRCHTDNTLDVTSLMPDGTPVRHPSMRFFAGETRTGIFTHVHSATDTSGGIEGAS